MRATAVVSRPNTSSVCYFCAGWPACLYKDINEKHSHRVCETCVEIGRVVRNANGVYIKNPDYVAPTPPEQPADPEASPA